MPDNQSSALPNNITEGDYNGAKTELSLGRTFKHEFDWYQTVELPIADSAPSFSPQKWRGITFELAAFVVGRPTPPNDENDEPVLLAQGSTPAGPKLVRYPTTAGSAPSVPKMTRKGIGKVVAYHSALDQEGDVRVQAQAVAYEEDFASILNALLDAIRSDAKTAAEFGLAQAPGLAAFGLQTPGAAVQALSDLIPKFRDKQVGGDVRVFDSGNKQWWRSEDTRTWEARKFTLHTTPLSQNELAALDANSQPGWYLAEWIITLSIDARSYEVASLIDSDVPFLDRGRGLHHAAALRIARGEGVAAVAASLGLPESDVALAANALSELDAKGLITLATSALATEISLLREKIGKTGQGPDVG